jgi:HJR/Mrr/RecB family endonuclease
MEHSGPSETTLVGEFIEVRPKEQIDSFSGLRKYNCNAHDQLPSDWSVWLTVPEDSNVSTGEAIQGWIYDTDQQNKEITVTTDTFGRADLHTLKDRHIEAADHIAQIALREAHVASEIDIEQVSHAKGLLSRCLRKDQWDWYTVYELLGKPPKSQLRQGQQALTRLREAAKAENNAEVQRAVGQLGEEGVARRFAYFVRRVNLGEEYGVIDQDALLEKLHELDPLVFEEFIADLWSQLGWDTEVVPQEEDRGVDVIATHSGVFTRKRAIQVKRKNPERAHRLDEIQRYMGLSHREEMDEVLLVTTGRFTETARDEATDSAYELMDGEELVSFIRENSLYQVVDEYLG